jgi:PAS domain S-box
VETANEGIWVVDAERTTTYVNRRMAEMLGYTPEEMIGRSGVSCLDHEGRAISDRNLEERRQGKGGSYELKLIRRDGSPLWAHVNAQSLMAPDGTFLGTLSMLSDITENKIVEEQLKEYAASLKRSNEDLERFAYVASHDLQEPLRNVVSFSQLLSRRYKGRMDPDADEFIGYIVEGGKRMQSLVQDLLEYSRVSTRGAPFQPTECEEVVDHVMQNLFFTIQESNTTIETTLLPRIYVDPGQMGIVFSESDLQRNQIP